MRLNFVIESDYGLLIWLNWQLMLVVDLFISNRGKEFSAQTVSFVFLVNLPQIQEMIVDSVILEGWHKFRQIFEWKELLLELLN